MQRRKFINAATVGSGAALLANTGRAQQPAPADQIRWRMTAVVPKSLDTIYGTAERFSKRVLEATNGRLLISVSGPGEIVPPNEAFNAVQQGSVDCAFTAGTINFGKDPTFALDSVIPFGMNSRQMSAWMFAGGGMQLMREFHRDYDILGFPCGNTGAQMAGWFRKEITSVSDLKGLKFRIGGFGGVVLSKLGVVPQNIPGGDVYTALERGVLDAAEWIGPHDDEKLGFAKVAKYYYYPGFWEGSSQISIYVNIKKWEALPRDIQSVIEAAAFEGHTEMQARYDALNPIALKRLIAGGTTLKAFPQPVLKAAWDAANETYEELSAKNAKWKKIYDSFVKFRDDEIAWFRVTEGSFDSFMRSVR